MAAGDSATALLDAASTTTVDTPSGSTESGAESTVDNTTEVDASSETTETGEAGAEGTETSGEASADKSAEGKTSAQKDALDKDSKTPVQIRKALKSWRDAADATTPEGKQARAVVNQLHQSYERWNAAKELFPGGFSDMKSASEFIKTNGGSITELQSRFDAVAAVDEKLYASAEDPKSAASLVEDILSDLKSEGKEGAMANLTTAFLSSLEKNVGDEAFAKVAVPVIARGLQESGAVDALNAAWRALGSGDTKAAQTALKGLGSWFADVLKRSQGQKEEPISAEAKKLAEDKAKFAAERESIAKTEVGKQASSDTAKVLGAALAPLMKSAFLKSLSNPAKQHIGATILKEFHQYCQDDKSLQSRYTALWTALKKNPNDQNTRQKLLSLNSQAATDFAAQNKGMKVRDIVAKIYPQVLKPSSGAEARIAAKAASKAQEAKATTSGQAVYVPSKPKDLARGIEVRYGNKTYSDSDLTILEISGKGFVKTADGKGYRLITWRKN